MPPFALPPDFPPDFPAALAPAAQQIFSFWLSKGQKADALAAKIVAMDHRVWVIEQAAALRAGRALDDPYPFHVMVHDGASVLATPESLQAEQDAVDARYESRPHGR